MPSPRWAPPLLAALLLAAPAAAGPIRVPRPWELDRLNRSLKGRVLDFTHNHGADRGVWCPSLGMKRDMYVYVPPGYDGCKQYPLLIWLHGFSQDEKDTKMLAKKFDEAVVSGKVPPMIIAIPDGTFTGKPSLQNSGSFFLNGVKGRYEDYLMVDLWAFLFENLAIRPERGAHAIVGASMGGTSAFNLAFKYKDRFGVVGGIMPLLDMLYEDCHGNHFGPFDPNCLGRMTRYDPNASAGRIRGFNIKQDSAMKPIFGPPDQVQARLPLENPVEMLELYDVKPGEFEMFIAYGTRDQFNGNAEAESFLFHAAQRGITAEKAVKEGGRHGRITGMSFFDTFCAWLTPRFSPYVPQ